MIRQRAGLFILLLAVTGPFIVIAQTISYEQFMAQLQQAHPLPAKERMLIDVEREAQNALTGSEDWVLQSHVGFSHEEPALSFAGPERTNAVTLSAGTQKLLWSTGGRLNASFETSTAGILPRFGFSMPLYQNVLAVSYVQPLLRNSGGSLDRLGYDLKQFDIDVSELEAAENIERFLVNAGNLYLTWAYLVEQDAIVAERLKLSEEESERTQEKRRANLVDQADVIRAEDAVRSWKQQQVLVRSHWKGVRAQLAVLAKDTRLNDLSPDFDLYAVDDVPPLDESLARLRGQSRVLKSLVTRQRQLEAGKRGYEETLRPDLSAYARVSTKRLDEQLGSSLLMDKPDASVGVQFSIPLGNTTARANVTRTEIQITRIDKQIEEVSLSLTSALTNVHIRLAELRQVLLLNREQIASARERTTEELKLYNQGRGDLTFVILSRDNEQNAKQIYAQNAWTYHTLRLEYEALMDEVYRGEGN